MKYIAPIAEETAFHCPLCGVYAAQRWTSLFSERHIQASITTYDHILGFRVAHCSYCSDYSIWYIDQLIFPLGSGSPFPHDDLPQDVVPDYSEARKVLGISTRSAAALMRLCLQKLCSDLGAGGDLNSAIGLLVERGLSVDIQRALDTVRVIGNNAVHPGQLDLRDDQATALMLFELVNLIVDRMIAEPRRIEEAYGKLPDSAKEQIERRDSKKGQQS